MSVPPPTPRSAAPPPRTGSHLLAIALLVLALIMIVSVMTVWLGLRFLARGVHVNVQDQAGKQVSITTPVGSLGVSQDIDESRLGLPIYPGAHRTKNQDAANISLDFGNQANLRVVAAEFETNDSLEKVKAFYKERLGSSVANLVEKDSEGKIVFEVERGGVKRIVGLHAGGGRTQIALVRVAHSNGESN